MADGTDAHDSRTRIVAAALVLFCRGGYAAVGVQDICTRAGVNKGTLYHFFPSKMDIALAALALYGDSVGAVFAGIAAGRGGPKGKLHKVFEASRGMADCHRAESGVMYGCLHGNLSLELAAADERARAALGAVAAHWATILAPVVATLPGPGTPAERANTLLAFLHGAVLMAKTANDPAMITRFGKQAAALLGG